jgi:REP element-mobilizing transposase RayT
MDSSPGFPRRPPRLDLFQDQRPFYFVTFNTARRRPLLANEAVFRATQDFGARGYPEHGVAIGRFVLMPDHARLFVVLPETGVTLARWMRCLKRVLGDALEHRGEAAPFWQEGFFDHVLRNGESYSAKRDYVRQNPVRAGLCPNAENWPWQGEIVALRF